MNDDLKSLVEKEVVLYGVSKETSELIYAQAIKYIENKEFETIEDAVFQAFHDCIF